jgi:hypothetical protein
MKSSFLCTAIIAVLFSIHVFGQQKEYQNTWTYTYLKANEGQKENLKQFLEKNWFAMDSIAVQQGLFNDYRLIFNNDTATEVQWDFIVAVEYFTKSTYSDIENEWLEIKQNHKTVLIDDKNFPELGRVISSEQLIFGEDKNINCQGKQYGILKPFLGTWNEYSVTKEEERLFGRLRIEIDPFGCSLRKEFQLLSNPFSYSTLGYFNKNQNAWIETFSGGDTFKWVKEGDDVLMINLSSNGNKRHRNRWTKPENSIFQIIEERSDDKGMTWEIKSITMVKRIGKY